MASKKAGGSNRKHGRNKLFCLVYKNSGQREINKARRLEKRIRQHPRDLCARAAMDRCISVIGASRSQRYRDLLNATKPVAA